MWAVLCVLALVLADATSAGAKDTTRAQHAVEGGTPAGSGREAALEARDEEQDAALRERIEEITAIGSELERAQARADDAGTRVGELDWSRALYSYNHADWYVKKVLAVAEAYRRSTKASGRTSRTVLRKE